MLAVNLHVLISKNVSYTKRDLFRDFSRVFTTPDAKLLEQASRHVRTLMAIPLPSAFLGNWHRASGPHSSSPDINVGLVGRKTDNPHLEFRHFCDGIAWSLLCLPTTPGASARRYRSSNCAAGLAVEHKSSPLLYF